MVRVLCYLPLEILYMRILRCYVSFLFALFLSIVESMLFFFFFQAEDGIRDIGVTGVQTCALPIFRTMQELDRVPIIMATAKGSEYDKVLGLDLGADDYLTKPFGMMELISRIKARLRRVEGLKEKEKLIFKELVVDLKERKVRLQEKEIELTKKEYDLLCFLINHKRVVYSREDLLLYVWGEEYMGETRTVDVHIGTLRNKLGD